MDETITLGPFQLGRCIGEGGMGKVFRAVHVDTGTAVAVKVIAGADDRASRRAFHREVQAHAGLVHPGVVYLFDYGTIPAEATGSSDGALSAGASYVAMELADRGTLRDHMCQDWQSVRRVLLQVLDALAFAHARGVIHRDLKPENLLLFEDAEADRTRVKLADFGLAHALDAVTERDERDLEKFSGTPHYMAPEQIRGQWRRYGPWTDLYALGCVAWHLVCGRPPYTGNSVMGIALKHCDEGSPSLEPRFAIPDGVEAWIRRAMATDPAARFQCAADAARALPGAANVREPSEDGPVAEGDAVDSIAPTAMMQTLVWQESGLSTEPAATIPISATTDMALADTVADELPAPSGQRSERSSQIDEVDQHPPVPPSWRPPDRDQLPTALLDAGLGLFGLREVPLVDREEERDLIWKALCEVVEERCLRVVFLVGEAGVGKSRLARWMATRAHEVGAARVYRAIYAPGTREAAAGIAGMIQNAFHTWKLGRGELYEELCERLPRLGDADDAVEFDARALTELVYPSTDGGEVDGPRFRFASRHQKNTLIARVLARLGRRRSPVVWLDDLHHNPDTVGLVEHLVTSNDPPTGLILATVRSDILADNPEIERRITDLADHKRCERIDVGPIGPADHRELIDRMLPVAAEFGDRLAERTEGNPLFAHQLLGDLIASRDIEAGPQGFQIPAGASPSVPDDIHQLWTGRIDKLVNRYPSEEAEAAREAIELAAALGREVATEEWRAVCADAGHHIPERLIDELVERGLARRTDNGWSFAHGLLVDSIERKSAEDGRWCEHHRRCATSLEQLYLEERGETARRRAKHWLAAGDDERALEPLLEAAEHYQITGDLDAAFSVCDLHDEARQRLGLGADDRRTVRALLKRVRLTSRVGGFDEVERVVERCEATCRRQGWDDLLAEVSVHQAYLADLLHGDIDSGIEIAQRALTIFEALDDQLGIARTLRRLGWLQRRGGDIREAHQSFQKAERVTGGIGDPRQHAISLNTLSVVHKDRHEYDVANEFLSRALQIFEEIGDPFLISTCLNGLGDNYRFKGDLACAEDYYRRDLADCIRAGINQEIHISHINLGIVSSMQGKFGEGIDWFQRALDVATNQNLSGWVGYIHGVSLFPVTGLGDWEGFDHHLERAREHLQQRPIFNRDMAECCAEAGRLAYEAGEVERARSAWEMAREQWVELDEPDEVAAIDEDLEALETKGSQK